MIISRITGGIGNQLFQYAAGRRLAHKFNTEFKLDITSYANTNSVTDYVLDKFNITAKIATSQEVKSIMEQRKDSAVVQEWTKSIYNIWNCPDDTYLCGYWENERYFTDIADIIREEFTFKPLLLSSKAENWKQQIISSECSISMHFRHGDFLYSPYFSASIGYMPLPFNYYYECINRLKQRYKNINVFVFSNNSQYVKENLHLDIPVEFIENHINDSPKYFVSYSRDIEDFYLMSICKHNIIANSTFSFWSSWLNQNPDKKVFTPMPASFFGTKRIYRGISAERNENSTLDSDKWIRVPVDFDNRPKVKLRPIFSLLLVVNNDAETIAETLDSILNQDYKYYEVIIIDNASTDGSNKICQQAIAGKENVTFRKLWTKVKNAEAWNMALNMTRGGGYYVLFLKGNDRFFKNTLTSLYSIQQWRQRDIIHNSTWLVENESGNIDFSGKKYSEQCDAKFIAEKKLVESQDGKDAAKLLLNKQINNFLATKLYTRNFLLENEINFDEHLDDNEVELSFQMECFLKSKYFMYIPNAVYVAPTPKLPVADKVVASTPKPAVADKVLAPTPKPPVADKAIALAPKPSSTARLDIKQFTDTVDADFQILSLSDEIANVTKPDWLQKGGIGYVIHSYAGKLEFVAKATADGKVILTLMGLDIRSPEDNSKRIPYWVDYTKLTVNGKTTINKITPAWHDKPYYYIMNVKAGEEIKIQVEWLPHIDAHTDKVVEPTPKQSVKDNTDAQIIDKFNRYLTARIDVKLMSTTGDFQILSKSDDKATVWEPKLLQKNGKGYQIQSYARKLEFTAKATVNGKIRVCLRGLDIRDEKDESKRIPYWIDYTKLTVNEKVIFDKLTPAWHDEFYRYDMDAKAGEEIKIQVEWLPNPKTILGEDNFRSTGR